MFKWFYWWKLSRKLKKNLKKECEMAKKMNKAEPPTLEQLEEFKKEWDLGWDSHMVTKIERRPKTYYEQSLN